MTFLAPEAGPEAVTAAETRLGIEAALASRTVADPPCTLIPAALAADPALEAFAGRVSDSGEGRWTIQAAIDEAVPAPVLTAALYSRFSSRGEADFQNKVLSALRHAFGGHEEKPGAK